MLGLIASLYVPATLSSRFQPFHETSQSKVAQQVVYTAPEGFETLNVVYFPQLGGVVTVFGVISRT